MPDIASVNDDDPVFFVSGSDQLWRRGTLTDLCDLIRNAPDAEQDELDNVLMKIAERRQERLCNMAFNDPIVLRPEITCARCHAPLTGRPEEHECAA